jgi:hypothetical protein
MRYETTSWSIEVSKGWVTQKEESCTSIFHPDGVGALQLSDYQNKSGKGYPDDLSGFVASENLDKSVSTPFVAGDFRGVTISSTQNGRFTRKWFLIHDTRMLYVTYNCQQNDKTSEVVSVESMLKTLKAK